MKNNMNMDFIVDKQTKDGLHYQRICVRAFIVWDAYTKFRKITVFR
jgi:hypothetical protein